MNQQPVTTRTRLVAASAAVVMLWCSGCASQLRAAEKNAKASGSSSGNANSGNSNSSNSGNAGGGSNGNALVHTRLAPGTVTMPAAGMHCHMSGNSPTTYRPDAGCTPGGVDDAVTQDDIGSTICTTGYTTKIRPPVSATDKVKQDMYGAYGVPDRTPSELDHLVSLELGGSNDSRNLWIEPGPLPNPKDSVENALHKAVCDHKVTLAAAQEAIATNWTTALAVTGAGK